VGKRWSHQELNSIEKPMWKILIIDMDPDQQLNNFLHGGNHNIYKKK